MKKGTKLPYLISASMLLVLASCDGGKVPSLTSEASVVGTSEPETSLINSDDSLEESSATNPSSLAQSSDRGTFNTTVLGNAFTESLSKDEWQMVSNNPKIQMGLSSYTVLGTAPNYSLMKASTNNVLLQADDVTVTKGLEQNPLYAALGMSGDLAMHVNFNNLTVVAGAISTILPNATNLTNQEV